MSKASKISYKAYFNDRLKQVSFHGLLSYPLYLQVTFERKSIFFKSYYFELFSKARYVNMTGIKAQQSLINKIIKKETDLIKFIVGKNISSFSFERLKVQYAHYCKDLLDEMQPMFLNYLKTFLEEEGLPALGNVLQHGSEINSAFDLIQDMKKAFVPSLYQKLVNNSLFYGPPYLPLYSFMLLNSKVLLQTITIKDWEEQNLKEPFISFLAENYPSVDAPALSKKIEEWVLPSKSK
jgi:hypothetical protein